MEVAFVSDIHSNKVALEAVKTEIDSKGVDAVVCLGDIVGYNPWPKECVEVVQNWCDVVIQGNHDRSVNDPEEYNGNKMAYEGLTHAREELSSGQLNWLRSLPESERVVLGGTPYLIVHSHPEFTDKYVMPKDFPKMMRYMDEEGGCFMGHTHVQHSAVVQGKVIVNPGSVGQPRDKDNRAAYAILDTDTNSFELYRTEYDIDTVVQGVEDCGLPSETGRRLYNGE